MHCLTCDEYADLVVARVNKTDEHVIVCTECDQLWENTELDPMSANRALDVDTFMEERGLPTGWELLEIICRLDSPGRKP